MATLADKRAASIKRFIAILGVSLFLTACSGGSKTGAQSTLSAPAFTSAPVTAAAQGAAYSYQLSTQPGGSTVSLTLATAPAGAVLTGNTITWTPSAAQSRVANQFSLTATDAAGTATQSWTVIPAGTVTGTWVDTFLTAQGPVPVPFDWTKVPIFPQALIPQPDGSFKTLQGSGNSDGTFSISNVPGGYYWLEISPRATYWTSTSSFDFGTSFNSPPPAKTVPVTTTTLDFTFDGLDPLKALDEVMFVPDAPVILPTVVPASSPMDATSFTYTQGISTNFDFSQIHAGYMLQYEPVSAGSWNALALGPQVMVSNLALTNGTTNGIEGNLSPSAPALFDLNVKGATWSTLFNNAGPATATPLGSTFEIVAQPLLNNSSGAADSGVGAPLLIGPQTLLQYAGFLCPNSGSGGSFGPVTGEPPISTDQDFGPVQYDDAFPASTPRTLMFCQSATVTVPAVGSLPALNFLLSDSQTALLTDTAISPLAGLVQNPTIGGMNLFAPETISATAAILSWKAPNGATPTAYKIAEFVSTLQPNGTMSYAPAGNFYTAKTSALLPLQPGQTYVFVISTVLDGSANFETSPNRSSLPTASVSVVSAPITIN